MKLLLLIWVSCMFYYREALSGKIDTQFTSETQFFDPDKSENCERYLTHVGSGGRELCTRLIKSRKNVPDRNCDEFIMEKRRHFSSDSKRLIELVARQYCNGTGSYSLCFKCFNMATERLWNRHPCGEYGKWKHIPLCLQKYINPNFHWSRATILNNTKVEIVAFPTLQPPYNKCEDLFEINLIHHSGNIAFPVDWNEYSEEDNGEMTIMFSLLLNAFEDNNPVGTTIDQTKYPYGIQCEEMGRSYYWTEYFNRLSRHERKGVPGKKLTDSYRTLRADMCGNVTECESCFKEGDVKFLFYARKYFYWPSKFISDYNETLAIYRNCLESYTISQEYVAILNKSHYGMDRVNMEDCNERIRKAYNILQENPSTLDASNITMRSKVIIDAVAFNAYSFFGYSVRHRDSSDCSVIKNGESVCFAKLVMILKDNLEFVRTEAEEDIEIDEFLYNIRSCDFF